MPIWPTLPENLQRPLGFPGVEIAERLIETHLSYVFLTKNFVYKIKKPIKFDFVDFSTLELREFYCREELRLNAAFAAELYLAVVPVVQLANGMLRVEPEADNQSNDKIGVVEWAVKMRRFEASAEADRLVEAGELTAELFGNFGRDLAKTHDSLPVAVQVPAIASAIIENFTTIDTALVTSKVVSMQWRMRLADLTELAVKEVHACALQLSERETAGAVRECHGDLHLSNMILDEGRLRAFDCLEFNRELRTIDVWNDVAFLFMDCCIRARRDLAYALVDGYLEASGDFSGLLLLPLYARYRSIVRAKVAALALNQHGAADSRARFFQHVAWARAHVERGPGRLLVTSGLSGSGKSFWANQLVPELGAIRLRSDVLRKAMEGLPSDVRTNTGVGEALYSAARSDTVYRELARLAGLLLTAGECVIVDATCLQRAQRDSFAKVAQSVGAECVTLHMSAPEPVLRARVNARRDEGRDPSEATGAVLDWQLQHQELPESDESVLDIDTCTLDLERLLELVREHFSSGAE